MHIGQMNYKLKDIYRNVNCTLGMILYKVLYNIDVIHTNIIHNNIILKYVHID